MDLGPFTWQVLATLVTGVLAVIAATVVALRQLAIARRQVEAAELTLREKLFERRIKVHDAVQIYLALIMRYGRAPERPNDPAFLEAMTLSRYLFPLHVFDQLEEIYTRTVRLRTLNVRMKTREEAGQPMRDGDAELEENMLDWLTHQLVNLHEIFGDHMLLAPSPPRKRRRLSFSRRSPAAAAAPPEGS